MIQKLFALAIIVFFFFKILRQRQKEAISQNEFIFWTSFWILAALAIAFIKEIDRFVAALGFSGSGINILFYLAVLILFYFIFKLRLRLAKNEKQLTDLTRIVTLRDGENKK